MKCVEGQFRAAIGRPVLRILTAGDDLPGCDRVTSRDKLTPGEYYDVIVFFYEHAAREWISSISGHFHSIVLTVFDLPVPHNMPGATVNQAINFGHFAVATSKELAEMWGVPYHKIDDELFRHIGNIPFTPLAL